MGLQTTLGFSLVGIGMLTLCVNAIVFRNITSVSFNGVQIYISVKREAIQRKIDAFHSSTTSKYYKGPRLYIPEVSVLPELHHMDHHPVFIDIGYLKAHNLEGYLKDNPKPNVSVSGFEAAVTIPLLAGDPTGPPAYALALGMFYEKFRGDFPKANMIYPYLPVDEISIDDYGAVVRNGSDEMRVSFNRLKQPSKPPTSIVKEEFEEFMFREFHFGLPTPDFSFCDRHFFGSEYCLSAERVKCDLHRYAPNVCQMWNSKLFQHCAATVETIEITSGFRNFILLGDDPINILSSEIFHDIYGSVDHLKYPCQELSNVM